MADEYDNTNRGALFNNKDKKTDNHPDLNGSVMVKGPDGTVFKMWVSGWMKVSKEGADYISLSLTEPQEKSSGRSLADMKAAAGKGKTSRSQQQELDDEVPF